MFILMIFSLFGCKGGKMEENKMIPANLKMVSEINWKNLSEKRIYFGHQSVGFNIVEGIKDVMKANPQIKLNILETSNAVDFSVPLFAHSQIGENGNPKSKCEAFAEFMEKGIGEKVDIAFLKFCYVDVTGKTDIKKMFEDYKRTIADLKQKYPKVVFVHFSVPLTTVQISWKTRLKILLGKEDIWEYGDNVPRGDYNELLKKEYGGKEPVFDLAAIESTHPDGKRESFRKGSRTYYSLIPDYTRDGGHLNEKGRKFVAEQLLIFLADVGATK
jgi:hypothetical protein